MRPHDQRHEARRRIISRLTPPSLVAHSRAVPARHYGLCMPNLVTSQMDDSTSVPFPRSSKCYALCRGAAASRRKTRGTTPSPSAASCTATPPARWRRASSSWRRPWRRASPRRIDVAAVVEVRVIALDELALVGSCSWRCRNCVRLRRRVAVAPAAPCAARLSPPLCQPVLCAGARGRPAPAAYLRCA